MELINEKDIEDFKVGDYILFGSIGDSREILFIVEEIGLAPLHEKKPEEIVFGSMHLMGDGNFVSKQRISFGLVFHFVNKDKTKTYKLNKEESKEYKDKLLLENL